MLHASLSGCGLLDVETVNCNENSPEQSYLVIVIRLRCLTSFTVYLLCKSKKAAPYGIYCCQKCTGISASG